MLRPLVAGALVASSFLLASPADAGCYGTREVFRVCYTLPEVRERTISQCVYTGGDDCEEVIVPFVGVEGDLVVSCTPGTVLNELSSPYEVCRVVNELFGPQPQR